MSTENRVESNLSALVSRRSFRQPVDSTGMGFQEELLSLTFESQTEFTDSAFDPQDTSSSIDQKENSTDESNSANDEENDRLERENRAFAFPLPLPQQSINNAPQQVRDSEIGPESPIGPVSVQGSASVESSDGSMERALPSYRTQPNDVSQQQVSNKPGLPSTEPSNQIAASQMENTEELGKLSTVNDQADLSQNLEPVVEASPLADLETSNIQQEPKKPIKKASSDSNRTELAQDSDSTDKNSGFVEQVAEVGESVSSQDALPYEQDEAPSRNRRVSRQDRLREENGADAKLDAGESRQSRDKEPLGNKAVEPIVESEDSSITSSQFDGIVVQAPLSDPVETNYSLAGQAIAGQPDSVVVNSAGSVGSTSTNVTAALAGAADKGVAIENGAVQPLVAGSGKGDPASAGNRGTGRAEGSTGSTALSRFQQNKLVQRVLKGLEQLSTGGGQVKLRLHPPELGTLQMTLKIEANMMSAHLEVENSLAKDALLNNLQSLRDRLSEQGMSIDRFEVEVRTDSQSGASGSSGESASNRQSRRDQPESRYAIYNENRLSVDIADEGKPAMPWFRTTGKLDLSV
ncbi:MAG: flagellar hook-length control protein FliK [Pirellula sp.]|nr:flagellar hook-length control protein FliK [Pirellula sp.]